MSKLQRIMGAALVLVTPVAFLVIETAPRIRFG